MNRYISVAKYEKVDFTEFYGKYDFLSVPKWQTYAFHQIANYTKLLTLTKHPFVNHEF